MNEQPDGKLDVRVEDGWYASYVDGRRVARFGTQKAAEDACRRMQRPEGRTARHPGFVTRRTPKVAAR